ncbi:Cloroperoxidase [Melanomma pulvis-pyrius CBS 109.77]|uniref:Cloroperoxidase n=1 Tax=Melanomma pulvis-pyrius CBS 109.77 TaxID=1314802 RepID=A0A6A6WYU2_9PLEO|nr:Cloroperoxidase [Melanomma pulvis-pyrius CBS 109.77]
MKPISVVFTVTLAGLTAAVDFGNWQPPDPGDARSPCPALNSLANHNIIPHDGKNLTVPLLVKAIVEALNVSVELATTVATAGLRTSSNPGSGTYTLDDLKKHNIIEHDGSLSRKDVDMGGNGEFSQETFDEFLGFFGGKEEITIPLAAAARWRAHLFRNLWGRIQSAKKSNPKFTFTASGQFNSYVESSIYMQLLKNPATGTTPLPFIKIFFEQERLPFDEGWRPMSPTSAFSLVQDVLHLSLNTPEEKAASLNGRTIGFHGIEL